MPLARIVASNPAAARETAQALRQAGYKVEIVPPGTPLHHAVDLEFDADSDKVISQKAEEYVPGEREFILKPLWRKLTAKYHANRDVARAQQSMPKDAGPQVAQPKIALPDQSRAVAPAAPERREERAAEEAAFAATEQRRIEKEQARRAEELRVQRQREEDAAVRQRELEARRAEELRLQRVREEQETVRQLELDAQRAEMRRQEEARRQQEIARQREYEQQQLALRLQEEERHRLETARRAEELEAQHLAQLAREREELRQKEAVRRRAEEEHRLVVIRQREEEERERRAHAQRLLIEATKQREEFARARQEVPLAPAAASAASIGAVPTMKEYVGMRWQGWKDARARKAERARGNVTSIDRANAFAWRQAWPITAVVAAAFLLGWGIAAYHDSTPKAVSSQPPVLTPGQYAPYPVKPAASPAKSATTNAKPTVKRRPAHDTNIAEDEVVTHHYYPSKATTAQNRTPQRKKITDLQ